MNSDVCFFAFLFMTAALFALVEIQIEGPHGWAEKLPTWKVDHAITRFLLGGKALTGYHFYVLLFVFLMLHFPVLGGFVKWSAAFEVRTIAFQILFWVLEDFLWFVLNPAFGLKRFTRADAWWHSKNWLWIMPGEYWFAIPAGVILYLCAGRL